jgi:3-methylcrotonyl-CoA carboxylase alpha subunit
VLALASLAHLARLTAQRAAEAQATADPASPWADARGWRLNADGLIRLPWQDGERTVEIALHATSGGYRLDLPGGSIAAAIRSSGGPRLSATLDSVTIATSIAFIGDEVTIFDTDGARTLRLIDPVAASGPAQAAGGRLTAPMPGRLVQVLVKAGDKVEAGQPLVVLEAMKMEHTVKAPRAGTVATVLYAAGDQVEEGASLVELEE